MPITASRPLNCFDSCFAEAARSRETVYFVDLLSLALLPSGAIRGLGQSRILLLSTQRSPLPPWLSLPAITLVRTDLSTCFTEPPHVNRIRALRPRSGTVCPHINFHRSNPHTDEAPWRQAKP